MTALGRIFSCLPVALAWIALSGCLQAQNTLVPDVVGMDRSHSETAINAAGLVVGASSAEHSDAIPKGSVMRQHPAGGVVTARGTAVTLCVSKGIETVLVPSVVGQPLSSARWTIWLSGLFMGDVSEQYSIFYEKGLIIEQEPPAGSAAPPGHHINFVVSKGPLFTFAPNVVGQRYASAKELIELCGLLVGNVTEIHSGTVASSVVVSQSPAVNSILLPGRAIDLVISKGPALLSLPDWSFKGGLEFPPKTSVPDIEFPRPTDVDFPRPTPIDIRQPSLPPWRPPLFDIPPFPYYRPQPVHRPGQRGVRR